MSFQQETGTARTSNGFTLPRPMNGHASTTLRLMQPPPATVPLSEGVRCFLLRQEQEGAAELTLAEYRGAAWSLFEFLQADPPWGELGPDLAPAWMDWLRTTPEYRRKRGAYPKHFSPQALKDFFAWPSPKNATEKFRGAETVAKYRRQGCRILRWLGIPVELERRKRRKYNRLPPIVPKFDEIIVRWQAILASTTATAAQRRQIVLTQALILLWGTRLAEALTASLDDMQGHWA